MELKLPKLNRTDILPISCLSFIVISLTTSSYVIYKINSFEQNMNLLAETIPATLYQTGDGEVEMARQYPEHFRREELVKKYVRRWIEEQFTWSGIISSQNRSKRDPGVEIDARKYPGIIVPTAAYRASFAFPYQQQKSYLKYLADNWVPNNYYSKTPTVTHMEIQELSPVKKLEIKTKNKAFYSIRITAILKEYNSSVPTGNYREWKREVIVVSIRPPINKPGANSTIYEKLSYRWKRYGLEIYDIQPFKIEKNLE